MKGNKYNAGRKHTPETLEKIRQHNRSPEHIALLKKLHTGNKYCVGRVMSEQTRAKIGKSVHLTCLKRKDKQRSSNKVK